MANSDAPVAIWRKRDRRTDGRTDGWTDGQTDWRTDGWTDGRTDTAFYARTHLTRPDGQLGCASCDLTKAWRTDRRTDRRTDGRTDGRTHPLIGMRGRIQKRCIHESAKNREKKLTHRSLPLILEELIFKLICILPLSNMWFKKWWWSTFANFLLHTIKHLLSAIWFMIVTNFYGAKQKITNSRYTSVADPQSVSSRIISLNKAIWQSNVPWPHLIFIFCL